MKIETNIENHICVTHPTSSVFELMITYSWLSKNYARYRILSPGKLGICPCLTKTRRERGGGKELAFQENLALPRSPTGKARFTTCRNFAEKKRVKNASRDATSVKPTRFAILFTL